MLLLSAVTVASCSEPGSQAAVSLWSGPQADGERTIATPEWQDVWTIGEGGSPLLAHPRLLAAGDTMVVWWDDYTYQLAAVDARDGSALWLVGKKGEGPEEFSDVRALQIDGDGSVVVLDVGNRRLSRISPLGQPIGATRLPEGFWNGLALLDDGTVVIAGDADVPFVTLSASGQVVGSIEVPWDGYKRLAFIQRQGALVPGRGGRWLYSFQLGDGWFPFDGLESLNYLGHNIEHMEFPPVVVSGSRRESTTTLSGVTNCSACDGMIRGDTVVFLYGGDGKWANSILDQYRWSDGAYLRSLVLPQPAREFAWSGDILILNVNSTTPRMQAFRVSNGDLGQRRNGR